LATHCLWYLCALKDEAFWSLQTQRLAPETGNGQSGVLITVVNRTTVGPPLPDRKTFPTVQAAEGIAPGTGLRWIGLLHLSKAVPA